MINHWITIYYTAVVYPVSGVVSSRLALTEALQTSLSPGSASNRPRSRMSPWHTNSRFCWDDLDLYCPEPPTYWLSWCHQIHLIYRYDHTISNFWCPKLRLSPLVQTWTEGQQRASCPLIGHCIFCKSSLCLSVAVPAGRTLWVPISHFHEAELNGHKCCTLCMR